VQNRSGRAASTSTLQTNQSNPTTESRRTAKQRADGKLRTDYQILKARASRARFILDKIAKNEEESKTDPRDAEDKIRCKETVQT